jgi:hypothetical protein
LAWACGEDSWRAFVGVAPVNVDISSPGFLGCTPLLELPEAAAAAYLGTYMLSLIEGLKFQEEFVVFYDILTRAHLISCLSELDFWKDVVHPHLSAECKKVLVQFSAYLAERRELLALTSEEAERLVALSRD